MLRRHLTPALIAFSTLLLSCCAAPLGPRAAWAAAAAAALCAGPSLVLVRQRAPLGRSSGSGWPGPSGRPGRAAILLLAASAGFALGAGSTLRMWYSSQRSFLPVPETQVSAVSGTVTQDSVLTAQGDTAVRLALARASSASRGFSARARGGMLLLVQGDVRFSIGETVEARVAPSALGPFGAERWIARTRAADIRSTGHTSPLWSARARAREWLHDSVSKVGYPASALLEALLLGVRQDVPDDLYQGFARTGSLHILALSGLHVTVIYGVAAAALWWVRRRWAKFAIATLVLLFYQALAGFMPSLTRATVMIVIGGVAVLRDRDREPLNVLALSGIVLLLVDPFQVFSVSFQLSFLALAGILVVGALVQRPLSGWLPRVLLAGFAMSAGAQAATLPLVIARFGAWYPSGLLANLALVPLTTGYLWAGLAWLPLSVIPWSWLHEAGPAAFDAFYQVIRSCANAFSLVPGITFSPSSIPWLASAAGVLAALASTLLPWKRPAGERLS